MIVGQNSTLKESEILINYGADLTIVNGTKYQPHLEMQTGIKDKMQDKPYTLRSISHQREVLYLYKVNFRSTSPRLDYSLEGGLISLPDRPYLERQYADETSANNT